MGADVLSSLSRVKGWLNSTTDNGDVDLSRLISGASAFILNYCNRQSFSRRTFKETYDGYGRPWIVLRQPDALSVSAVSAHGNPLPAAVGDGITTRYNNGFVLLGQRLELHGHCFPNHRSSIYVEYDAGFVTADEEYTVPDQDGYCVDVTRFWLSDDGVTLFDGTPLVKVAEDPDDGEYSVSTGCYHFNSAQANEAVFISYSYAPEDVVEAVTELVGERYRYKDHIGQSSKSLGGQETVSFSANKMPPHLVDLLNSYRRVV